MHLIFTAGFANKFFQPVCWILIHSLWQGLIAAIAAAVIISLTKRSAATIRYSLLLGVLTLFVVSISITAWFQFQLTRTSKIDSTAISASRMESSSAGFNSMEQTFLREAVQPNFTERLITYCNENANVIVMVWFLFFLIKCIQLVAGLQYIRRIRRWNNGEVSAYWKRRLMELSKKTGIRKPILFLESEMIKVPAVIGFLKPVLLVPVGLLSGLPTQQIEAILLHELAHIRRRDFLTNLLQSFIETFFFFNPAIVWISSLIRQEREACCDDMVIANTAQKGSYLQALISFQEMHLQSKTHAMALTGNKHYLFNRVKRMLTQENKKLNLMEKTVLLLSIIGITAFSFITKEKRETPLRIVAKKEISSSLIDEVPSAVQVPAIKMKLVREKKPLVISTRKNYIDTVPKTVTKEISGTKRSFPNVSSSSNSDGKTMTSVIEATDDAGKQYRVKRVDGQVTEIWVNGAVIPATQHSEYNDIIRQIDETQRQRIAKKKTDFERKKEDIAVKRKELFERKATLARANQKEHNEKLRVKHDSLRQYNFKKVQADRLVERKNEMKKRENERKHMETTRKQKLFKQGGKSNDDVSRIINDLDNRQLVADSDNLSFSLTNNELVVNGKKQPAEVHQQFKEKYIQKNGDRFKYSKRGNNINISISRE